MTSQEVRELLGEPYDEKVKGQVGFEEYSTHDDRTDMIFYYRLREDIISGWEIYLIRFKNNVVFETETGVEDWWLVNIKDLCIGVNNHKEEQ